MPPAGMNGCFRQFMRLCAIEQGRKAVSISLLPFQKVRSNMRSRDQSCLEV
jgi:hypothetical protein